MNNKRIYIAVMGLVGLLAVAVLSNPGRATLKRIFSGVFTSGGAGATSQPTSPATPNGDLGDSARARHGWNASILNTVVTGTITFYNEDGSSARQGLLTLYRRYPDRLRVVLVRGAVTEVAGFNGTEAWSSQGTINPGRARDIRIWLRLCPERLFVSRGAGATYREAGSRVESFRAARPWQAQQKLNPPLALEQVEMEDLVGPAPDATRVGDRRRITYYLNKQDYTIESARWLEPDDPGRNIDDDTATLTDVRVDFADWRNVSGVWLPFEVTRWTGGKVDIRIVITGILVNQTLAETLFQQP